jgi:hypothetical protein
MDRACSTKGEKRNAFKLLMGKPEGKRDGWIIVQWILERWDGALWTGLVLLRIGSIRGLL